MKFRQEIEIENWTNVDSSCFYEIVVIQLVPFYEISIVSEDGRVYETQRVVKELNVPLLLFLTFFWLVLK